MINLQLINRQEYEIQKKPKYNETNTYQDGRRQNRESINTHFRPTLQLHEDEAEYCIYRLKNEKQRL